MSAPLKVGDTLPSGVTFSYIPYTPEKGDITSCGIPISYDASKGKLFHALCSNSAGPASLLELPYPSISSKPDFN
jgi:hypothetical protein